MLCCVLHGKRDLRLDTREVPRPGPAAALVRVRRVGICGSDLRYFEHGRAGSFVARRPFVLGHEGAGEVVETGAGVAALAPGTRVVIDPSQPCGGCGYCRRGRYNLCRSMRFLGSASVDPHVDGLFSEFVVMPAANCHPMPDGMDYAAAALVEPITIALHALKRAAFAGGASALILGAGTIGLLALLLARTLGAATVAVGELLEKRRALAATLGADATFDPSQPSSVEQALALGAGGFDLVLEASGAPAALAQALDLVRPGGTVVVVGSLPAEVTLPANAIMAKELQVLGSFRSANVFAEAVGLAASGRIDFAPLVTKVLPLSRVEEAMQVALSGGAVVKVQLEC